MKLLRVLQERSFERLGETQSRRFRARGIGRTTLWRRMKELGLG